MSETTITVVGNIATAPEHKRTAAGVAITSFRVGSGRRRFDKSEGAWVDEGTNWYTVSTYRAVAEHAFRSLRKGDRVILTGRLRLREWSTGEKKGVAIEIDADAIGHDLLFGTTVFNREGQIGNRPAADAVPTATIDEAWQAAESEPGDEEAASAGWPLVAIPDTPESIHEDDPALQSAPF